MADTIFQRAWGHYIKTISDLGDSGNAAAGGIFQPYNLATLLPRSEVAENYNQYLIRQACNYVGSTQGIEEADERFNRPNSSHSRSLDEIYGLYLSELDDLLVSKIPTDKKGEHDKLEGAVNTASMELEKYSDWVDEKWDTASENDPADPPEIRASRRIEWERDRGYSSKKERKRRKVRLANAKVNAFLKKHTPAEFSKLLKAKTYYDDPGYWIKLPLAESYDKPELRHTWEPVHLQNLDFVLEEFFAKDDYIESSFKTSSSDYSKVETKWKAKIKSRWSWFSGGGSVERRKMEEISEKEEFGVKISFKKFQEVNITRGSWFQDVLFSNLGKGFPYFWGINGALGAIPYSLFLCRGLKIEITSSEDYHKNLEKFTKTGGSVGFGSFLSGRGSYQKDEKYINIRHEGNKFIMEDSAETIRILGSRVRTFNWDDEEAEEYFRAPTEEDIKKLTDDSSS